MQFITKTNPEIFTSFLCTCLFIWNCFCFFTILCENSEFLWKYFDCALVVFFYFGERSISKTENWKEIPIPKSGEPRDSELGSPKNTLRKYLEIIFVIKYDILFSFSSCVYEFGVCWRWKRKFAESSGCLDWWIGRNGIYIWQTTSNILWRWNSKIYKR